MPEWNMQENLGSGKVSLTVYSPAYDGELEDKHMVFDVSEIYNRIPTLDFLYKSFAIKDDKDEAEGLIGINSDSLNPPNMHNIFLEWDKKAYVPPMEKLRELNGTIIETGGGIHFIKEAAIRWDDLYATMLAQNCCKGFMYYSNRRKRACLRVCPKESNYLNILEKKGGSFISLYEFIVGELHKGVSDVDLGQERH